MPVIRYKNPDTGQLEEVSGERRNWTPVVEYPKGVTVTPLPGPPLGRSDRFGSSTNPKTRSIFSTSWKKVDPEECFARQFKLENLKPATSYTLRVESRDKRAVARANRRRALPDRAVAHGIRERVSLPSPRDKYARGSAGWLQNLSLDDRNESGFLRSHGDIVYDKLAKTRTLRGGTGTVCTAFLRTWTSTARTSSYFIKDDHDTWMNDCWPAMKSKYMGEFTAKAAPMFLSRFISRRTYRTFRWGKDLQIWLVEDLTPQRERHADGPENNLGAKQKRWFKQSVSESDATFRVLISRLRS